jgi:predicted nuclease of predicted toxin-antitoxin system
VRTLGRDPGDVALLRRAANERRILLTIDTDFGPLIHLRAQPHAGLIRLPDVPPAVRIELMAQIFARCSEQELSRSVVTVKGSRIRIARRGPAADSRTS